MRGTTMKAVIVGDEMLAAQCAIEARRHGLTPCAVVSTNDLVLDEAREAGIDTFDARERSLRECLHDVDFDVLLAIAYQRIIPPDVLALADVAVNFHDGLLPEYGGLNVTTWSVLNGEREHGVTWHLMSELADRGDIVHEVRFDIGDEDTAFSVNARCYEAGLASFPAVAAAIASGTLERRPQTDVGRRMYRRVERPLVFFDPQMPAAEIVRAVRAVDVGPRAFGALGAVRWQVGDAWLLIAAAIIERAGVHRTIGEFAVDEGHVTVQTIDGIVELTDVRTYDGAKVDAERLHGFGMRPGIVVESPSVEVVAALAEVDEQLAGSEAAWSTRLQGGSSGSTTLFEQQAGEVSTVVVPHDDVTQAQAMLAVACWIDGVGAETGRLIGVTGPSARDLMSRLPVLLAPLVDFSRDTGSESIADFESLLQDRTGAALADGPFLADLIARDPSLRERVTLPSVVVHLDVSDGPLPAAALGSGHPGVLEVEQRADGSLVVSGPYDEAVVRRIAGQLASLLDGLGAGATKISELSLLSSDDEALMANLNDTDLDVDLTLTIDEQFRRRCVLAGDAPALSARGVTLSYAELDQEVRRVAALLHESGVRTGDTVGIALARSSEMVISVLAAMSLGAHYLPLDPGYPAERLELMVADSGTSVIVASSAVAFDHAGVHVVDPANRPADMGAVPAPAHGSDALAYVIYTSGSTGRPKGVELEHRQVVNFFAAMDAVIEHDDESVWLAATSLSFDISVLELLWTLTRGLHVVVQRESGYGEGAQADTTRVARSRTTAGSMSMFYFAADEAQAATGYRLLLESAKWADQHGFEAVWTPERHFHDFGAPYPNPSVVGAALAATTEQIQIRAGSVVLPLHSPVRVAEEWAVVDNLSGGRVGLSFASGWQPNDFVLRPEAYATARDSLPGLVDTVQRLWRGESVDLPGHDGQPVSVVTKPRPVQAELPTWITSAGSPASFERAGRLGANILTHLVGQTTEQLSDNIAGYRAAWDEAGHVGSGRVTLMLHTFLDADGDLARETARLPLKGYLGTAVGLLKDLASAFPTFHKAGKDADEAFRSLTDDEMSQLLDLVTERYLTTSGLFGTVDDAIAMADTVLAVGVDEIACLIDFGIDDDLVLTGLDLLDRVREHVMTEPTVVDEAPETFADLVERYGVSHFQCTPSLASMLLAGQRDRAALGRIEHLMVGGEALPLGLATELRERLAGRLTNMYGPTETTIWSLVHEIVDVPASAVPIGRPIANTQVRVLDGHRRDVPVGVFGELHIGGDGVARGYRGRPELNAERFADDGGGARLYATGDVARVRDDGVVEFGGRADHQVKIRGHRIELAEVESVLDQCPAVARSVVVARGDSGATLLAFVVIREEHIGSAEAESAAIRSYVSERLPSVMVPSAVGVLDDLPLTPNGKIDRNGLPDSVRPIGRSPEPAADVGTTEELVTRTWTEQLGVAPSRDDNFFDIGGHSLLAVKMFREFGESYPGLALTDLFRFPTVRTFADHLEKLAGAGDGTAAAEPVAATGTDRGARRRRARSRGAQSDS